MSSFDHSQKLTLTRSDDLRRRAMHRHVHVDSLALQSIHPSKRLIHPSDRITYPRDTPVIPGRLSLKECPLKRRELPLFPRKDAGGHSVRVRQRIALQIALVRLLRSTNW